jgi:hypothetical protein
MNFSKTNVFLASCVFFLPALVMVSSHVNTTVLKKISYIKYVEDDLNPDNILETEIDQPAWKIRPVWIRTSESLPKNIFGMAYISLPACYIAISPEAKKYKKSLKITILHEWYHCVGYTHTENPLDLMYPSVYPQQWDSRVYYKKDGKK